MVRKSTLPLALMRYMLTFIHITAADIKVLCCVCRSWRSTLTTPGAIRSCDTVNLRSPGMLDNLPWLGGVAKLEAEFVGENPNTHCSSFMVLGSSSHPWKSWGCQYYRKAAAPHAQQWKLALKSLRLMPRLHTLKLHLAGMRVCLCDRAVYSTLFTSLGSLQVLDLKDMFSLHDLLAPLTSLTSLTLRRELNRVSTSSFDTLTALQELHLHELCAQFSTHEAWPSVWSTLHSLENLKLITMDGEEVDWDLYQPQFPSAGLESW